MANTVFTDFAADDKVQGVQNRITNAMWSNNVGILTTFITSSDTVEPPVANDRYYYNIYGSSSYASTLQVEFSIAFGDVSGAGAITTDYDYPTKALYGQYIDLLLDPITPQFAYDDAGTTVSMSQFFAISIKRANLKQKLDPGNWELHISGPSASVNNKYHLIDDSGDSLDTNATDITRVFTVVSGTIDGGKVGTKAFGLVYPDYGIIILDPHSFSESLAFTINSSSGQYTGSDDHSNLFHFYKIVESGSYFAARSEENISSTHYFVRIKNQQYNYSSNPTFYSSSDGTILNTNFFQDPQVFVTTVGLYNSDNELLAVAKLSQPINKAFDKEALVKVRLDF